MARVSKAEKEKIIQNHMSKLGITREEAEQLYEDDKNDFIGETGEQMTVSAKAVKRYEKSDAPRKTQKERTKKEHPEKKNLIMALFEVVQTLADCATVTNEERQIAFAIGENNYELTLIQKRKAK